MHCSLNSLQMDSSWQNPETLETVSSHSLGKVSELMILDQQCGVLVHKRCLHNLQYRKAQQLFSKHMKLHGPKALNPYFRDQGIDFFYLNKNDVFLVAAAMSPEIVEPFANIIYLDILQRLYDILKNCIGAVNEAYITVNRMLVFEILDEMTIFGYSFQSSYTEVKPFLTLEPIKPKIAKPEYIASRFFGINTGDGTKADTASSETKPKTPNSAYINIVEGVSAIFGPTGEMCSSELWGKLTLISNLERPSPVMIELNPDLVIKNSVSSVGKVAGAIHIETPSFHSCVDSSQLATQKTLRALPPSGQTRLMVYTLSDPSCISIPIILIPILSNIEDSRDKCLKLRLINQAENYAVASYVQVKVQLPETVVSVFNSSTGDERQSSQYKTDDRLLEWVIKKMSGRTEHVINSRLKTQSDKELCLPDIGPITMTFNLTQFSASGLVVKRAKVEAKSTTTNTTATEPAPQCFFGMSTKAVSYTVRTGLQSNVQSSIT